MSQLLVDDIVNKDDSGSPGFSKGAVVTGIVTAQSGFNIGIQSGHTLINTGVGNSIGIVTAINFVGSGNTVVYNSSTKTVDIAISGGSGGISTTYQNISSTSATGIATFSATAFRSASIILSVTQGTSYQGISSVENDNQESCSGELWLFNPSSTTYVKHFVARFQDIHSAVSMDTYTAGYFNTTSAIDEISFKCASGNIDSGTFKLYGIKDS